MPSRLRYLFQFQPEGPYAHTGTRALSRLRRLYLDAVMASSPFELLSYPPTSLKGLELARWYFTHLPPEILKYCSLQIVREPRRCSYASSPANPRTHGWLPFNERKTEQPPHKVKKPSSHTYTYHVSYNKKQPPQPPEGLGDMVDAALTNWTKPPKAPKKPPKPPAAAPTKKPSLKIGVWS